MSYKVIDMKCSGCGAPISIGEVMLMCGKVTTKNLIDSPTIPKNKRRI